MSEQTQKQKPEAKTDEKETSDVKGLSKERQAEVDKLKGLTDDFLDEIDEILEQVGTEVATSFIQKGGE